MGKRKFSILKENIRSTPHRLTENSKIGVLGKMALNVFADLQRSTVPHFAFSVSLLTIDNQIHPRLS